MRTVLSYGMGVESTAILARWILEPRTRPCDLAELTVLTAQTGDEYADTGRDVERHILPLLRAHGVRYVQVARHGHLEADGITVLEDSRSPARVYLEGDYKLSDELRTNGTVPQFGGEHRCSLKFKAFVCETWLAREGSAFRHAFGYNNDEQLRADKCRQADERRRIAFGFNVTEADRIARTARYDSAQRESFFPLHEWEWNREDCLAFLLAVFGVYWKKSACVECPFLALRPEAIARHKEHPVQVADAMLLEYTSLAMNPRGTLFPNKSLIQITLASGNNAAAAAFEDRLRASAWSLYRVRRIYNAATNKKGVTNAKGTVYRAVEQDASASTRAQAETKLAALAAEIGGTVEIVRGLSYLYLQRKADTYPAREEYYTVAPAYVRTKARYGIAWFDALWHNPQHELFPLTEEATDAA